MAPGEGWGSPVLADLEYAAQVGEGVRDGLVDDAAAVAAAVEEAGIAELFKVVGHG